MTFSDVLVTPFSSKVYEDGNLQKLADKGLYGCSSVVGADGRKLRLYKRLCHSFTASVLAVLLATLRPLKWLFSTKGLHVLL